MPWVATQIEWKGGERSPIDYTYIGDKRERCVQEVVDDLLLVMDGTPYFKAIIYDVVNCPDANWLRKKIKRAEQYRGILRMIQHGEVTPTSSMGKMYASKGADTLYSVNEPEVCP